jgi:hypothetical protein
MVIGTNLFTLTVGSVSTMIGALDDEIRARDQKLEVLTNYAIKH